MVSQSVESLNQRECLHRRRGVEGTFHSGETYVRCLQRLRSDAAMKAARKVEPFFWADAPLIKVWLCEECANEVGL
jgi:hypothetical protein